MNYNLFLLLFSPLKNPSTGIVFLARELRRKDNLEKEKELFLIKKCTYYAFCDTALLDLDEF